MLLDTYLDNFFGMTEMKIPKTLSHPGSGWALGFRSENKWNKTFNGLIKFNGPKVTSNTLFDLASLTKVVGTLPACFVLMQEGSLNKEYWTITIKESADEENWILTGKFRMPANRL